MKDNADIYTFKTGVVDGKLIDLKQLTTIANLPSKEELISKLLYVLNSTGTADRHGHQRRAARPCGRHQADRRSAKPADRLHQLPKLHQRQKHRRQRPHRRKRPRRLKLLRLRPKTAAADAAAEPVETATEAQEEAVAAAC